MGVRNRRLGRIVEADLFPGLAVGEQLAQQFIVQLVPGFVAEERTNQAVTEQIQVADRVEDLVLDELVLVTQAVFVEHAVIVEDDRVVHRTAQREILFAQHFDVAHEAERARAADFLDERGRREVDLGAGSAPGENRVVEVDRETDLEAVERLEPRPLVAVADDDRLLDAHEALRSGLFLDSGRLQQEHERTCAAIHDRHFGRRKIHVCVVDAQAGERREQVLDRGDADAILDQGGRQPGIADILAAGTDFDWFGQVDTTKNDARIDRSGTQRHVNLFTGVKANTGRAYHILKRTLSDHLFYFPWGQEGAKRAES